MTIGVSAALTHLRTIVEGSYGSATYPITAGRFLPTDDRLPLDEQPEHSVHRRYELLPVTWTDGFEETGLANLTGQLVDGTLEAVLRVGYYFGGGDMAPAGQVGVTNEMAEDAFLLRRVLTPEENLDRDNTGIIDCRMGPATFDFAEPGDRRAMLTMPLTIMITDDWSSE